MSYNETIDSAIADQHRLSIADLQNLNNLTDDIMFDLSDEEFENMMNQMNSSTFIEPLYFSNSSLELEPHSIGCY